MHSLHDMHEVLYSNNKANHNDFKSTKMATKTALHCIPAKERFDFVLNFFLSCTVNRGVPGGSLPVLLHIHTHVLALIAPKKN